MVVVVVVVLVALFVIGHDCQGSERKQDHQQKNLNPSANYRYLHLVDTLPTRTHSKLPIPPISETMIGIASGAGYICSKPVREKIHYYKFTTITPL